MGNDSSVETRSLGTIRFDLGSLELVLNKVLYVPDIIRNIISIPVLDSEGYETYTKNGKYFIKRNNSSVHIGTLSNGLYLTQNINILNMQREKKT